MLYSRISLLRVIFKKCKLDHVISMSQTVFSDVSVLLKGKNKVLRDWLPVTLWIDLPPHHVARLISHWPDARRALLYCLPPPWSCFLYPHLLKPLLKNNFSKSPALLCFFLRHSWPYSFHIIYLCDVFVLCLPPHTSLWAPWELGYLLVCLLVYL